MKHIIRISIILFLLVGFLSISHDAVYAQDSGGGDGKVVFGGSYTLKDGESLNGDLAIFGGTADIQDGATINGSVFVSGGSIKIGGTVNGDIAGIGGTIVISDTAVIHGNVVMVGGSLDRSPKASIIGDVTSGSPKNLNLKLPTQLIPSLMAPAGYFDIFNSVRNILRGIFSIFALSALAVLVALFLPKHTRRVAESITNQPILSGGFGILTVIVAPVIIAFLLITCLLIPVGFAAILVLVVGSIFGWIALGFELGRRMAKSLKTEWSDPVSAGVGTLLLTLISSLMSAVCCGFIFPILLGILGLGAVIISRFGTRVYPGSMIPPAAAAPSEISSYQSTEGDISTTHGEENSNIPSDTGN